MASLKSQGFQKQGENRQGKGYSVSLWYNLQTGVYAVQSRKTSASKRDSKVEKFVNKLDAEKYFEAVLRGNLSPFGISQSLNLESYMEQAKSIVRCEDLQKSPPHLTLLFAIDRVKTRSRDLKAKNYLSTANSCLKILRECTSLPSPRDTQGWRSWGKKCASLLISTSFSPKKVAFDTAKSRMSFFLRALQCLVDYGYLFPSGEGYSQSAIQAISAAKEFRKIHLSRETKKRETFKPISASKIEKLVKSETDFKKQLFVLKTLFGFRPSEALACSSAHLADGKVNLPALVTKTVSDSDKQPDIARPYAPLFLRVICRIEKTWPAYKLADFKNVRPKGDSVCLRRLRTIAACHIYFSTKDINAVKERCGHQTIEMGARHYAKFVSEIEVNQDQTSGHYYETEGGVFLSDGENEKEIAKDELGYDKFLLSLLLEVASAAIGTKMMVSILNQELDNTKNSKPQGLKKKVIRIAG